MPGAPTHGDTDPSWVDIADLAEWLEKEVGSDVGETESGEGQNDAEEASEEGDEMAWEDDED